VRAVSPKETYAHFSPLGKWVGSYSCAQGYTGGTLDIDSLSGKNFKGVFKFYPTPKNPHVPNGSYHVYGQYDHTSHRILINPGKWIKKPPNFANTIIVGGFDPATHSFSGYFQGIVGCTSFEAKLSGPAHELAKPRKKAKKKAAKPASTMPTATAPVTEPAPAAAPSSMGGPPSPGIPVGGPPAAAAPLVPVPPATPTIPPASAPQPILPSSPPPPLPSPGQPPAATP
jgi:hypothetical protein